MLIHGAACPVALLNSSGVFAGVPHSQSLPAFTEGGEREREREREREEEEGGERGREGGGGGGGRGGGGGEGGRERDETSLPHLAAFGLPTPEKRPCCGN